MGGDDENLSTLTTAVDVYHSLGLPDIPLEEVNLVNSLCADDRSKNPLSEQATPGGKSMPPEAEETMPPEANQTETMTEIMPPQPH